jgi:hypothetical protein
LRSGKRDILLDGERRTENGERRTENGERRKEKGERRTENGSCNNTKTISLDWFKLCVLRLFVLIIKNTLRHVPRVFFVVASPGSELFADVEIMSSDEWQKKQLIHFFPEILRSPFSRRFFHIVNPIPLFLSET